MDQLRAQLGNYLEWLESRGLTGTVAFRTPVDAPAQPATSEPQAASTPSIGAEKSAANPAHTPRHPSEATHADARSAAALRSASVSAPQAGSPRPLASDAMASQREAGRETAHADSKARPDMRGEIASDAMTAQSQSPNKTMAEATGAQREAGMPWKVGFYSSSDLTEEEFIMVSKIALALGLPVEDFKIWAEDSLVHVPVDLLRCSYIVALGPGSGQTLLALGQSVAMNTVQKALQGSPLLTIPHPRAMLREPGLKGGAWTALQKFKALMEP